MRRLLRGLKNFAVFLFVLLLTGIFGATPLQANAMESARDDGTWLWPLPSYTVNSVSDWEGCTIGACPFNCGLTHTCAATSHNTALGHAGMDIGVAVDTPVYAAADGKVVAYDYQSSRGYTVVLEHEYKEGWSYYSYYQHLNYGVVSVGSNVTAGQHIANSGNTGVGTAAHLHFSIVFGPSNSISSMGDITTFENCGWLLTNSYAQGRILVNPAATNEVAIGDLASGNLSRHKGSVHYTCDPSHVNIGMNGSVVSQDSPWYYSGTPTTALWQNMVSNEVKWLQQALNVVMAANLSVDGSFGPGTYNAVIAFQNYFGLVSDGMFGPASLSTMLEQLTVRGYMSDGSVHSHTFTEYVSNGDGTHMAKCEVCQYVDEQHKQIACSGGTATSTTPATCEFCGEMYGTVNEEDEIEAFVTRMYQVILEREPDAGSATWVNGLKDGSFTGVRVADGFVLSEEMLNKDISNEDFVKILYRAFFGREADADGLKTWTDLLDAGCKKQYVFAGFANSTEFGALCAEAGIVQGRAAEYLADCQTGLSEQNYKVWCFVERIYMAVLERTADLDGVKNWVGLLQNGTKTGIELADGFLMSEEFLAKDMTDEEYVQTLYRAFFNRDADPEGLATWTGALATGWTKKRVFAGFANSTEFGVLCEQAGIVKGTAEE